MIAYIQANALLPTAVLLGFLFGFLLQRGGVTDFNVIVNQFRLRDFTVMKLMLTAIIVGGLGVFALRSTGHAQLHIKELNVLALVLGSILFGIGMVLYGYCPGTGVAAIGTGSIHALVGFAGMLVGGILFALSFPWIKANLLATGAFGQVRLPELTGIPDLAWFGILIVVSVPLFLWLERPKRTR